MGMGMSMVEGCTVVGGMEGITTHSSMTDIVHDRVSGTEMRGISVDEMSMGTVMDSEVSGALGIGIYCNDRSTCMIEHNTVVGTRPDIASGNPTRRGFGVLASFQSLADLRGNELASNPVPMGAVINSADCLHTLKGETACRISICPKESPAFAARSPTGRRLPSRCSCSPRRCSATTTRSAAASAS